MMAPSESTPLRGGGHAWFVWFVAAAFVFLELFVRVIPGVMAPAIERDLAMDAGGLGASMGLYYLTYAPMQLVAGVLIDRWGTRWIMPVAALLCGGGLLISGLADSAAAMSVGRLVSGTGSAVAFVGAVYAASIWFKAGNLALIGGLTTTMGMSGAALGTGTATQLQMAMGWRGTFLAGAIACGVLAVVLVCVLPRRPPWAESTGGSLAASFRELGKVLACGRIWIIGLVSLLVYTPISAFGALWGASYIEAALPGTSASEAGWVVAMLFIGIAVMGPIVGRISDRSGNRAGLMGIGSIVMAVSLTGLVFLPSMNLAVAFVLVLLVGAATSIQVVTYAAGMELQPPSRHGAAVAFVNFSAMFSGLLMQPLIGEVLNLERPAGEATNSIENYQVALLTLPICAVIAVVLCGVLVIARRRSS